MSSAKNIFGRPLKPCCKKPVTGFYRTGCCETGPEDLGAHVVCVQVTDDFLEFSKARGNDLSTPIPEYDFPGLKEGDRWCLCALRWKEAYEAGVAPPIILSATHEEALKYISMDELRQYGLDD